jgi:hypothetical protein
MDIVDDIQPWPTIIHILIDIFDSIRYYSYSDGHCCPLLLTITHILINIVDDNHPWPTTIHILIDTFDNIHPWSTTIHILMDIVDDIHPWPTITHILIDIVEDIHVWPLLFIFWWQHCCWYSPLLLTITHILINIVDGPLLFIFWSTYLIVFATIRILMDIVVDSHPCSSL